ncbi:MAG TPA: enoyl-CoA hydratase-related protein [Candidatus Angelobacter sp.]|jgi:enoyl-CoA hydratase
MPDHKSVLYQEGNGVALITLNRPQALNALSMDLLRELLLLLDVAEKNDSVKALIITGVDKAFSAGADIKFLNQATPLAVRDFARLAIAVNHKIETLGKVVIAAINGYAFGGGLEMAEACMIRIAAHTARLGHPEVRIGAIAGFGGTTRLARLVGKGRAAELLLRGRTIAADEALEIGLIQSIVEPGRLMAEAEAIVRDIISQSPIAVRLTWEALHRGMNLTLEESALLGADYFGLVASTNDFRIGTKAFIEKKDPGYTGT